MKFKYLQENNDETNSQSCNNIKKLIANGKY